MSELSGHHRRRAEAARANHAQVDGTTTMVVLFSRLMAEHSAAMKEVVGEYERAAVDYAEAVVQVQSLMSERGGIRRDVAKALRLLRGGERRKAEAILNGILLQTGDQQ